MTTAPTADQMALRLLLAGEQPGSPKLRALAEQVAHTVENRLDSAACPDCGDEGPHEDNGGRRGRDLTFLCRGCSFTFDHPDNQF